jgi:hypothetical protein
LGFEFHEGLGCIRYERFIILDAIIGCIGMKFMGTRVVQKSGTTMRTISNGSDFTRTPDGIVFGHTRRINDDRISGLIRPARIPPHGDGVTPLTRLARCEPHGCGENPLRRLAR